MYWRITSPNSAALRPCYFLPFSPLSSRHKMARVYRSLITACDKFVPSKLRPLWEHEAGPKTIFFWAPAFKWALVAASIDDFRRPLDKVSTTQSATLAATGFIWTRYCLVIRPVNYALSFCNFSLGVANGTQFARAFLYQRALKTL